MRRSRPSPLLCAPMFALVLGAAAFADQTPAPQTQPRRPAAQQPRAPKQKPKPQATQPSEPARPPAPPLAEDVRFTTTYTTGDMKTDSVTFVKGQRERFEFRDMVLLKQHDQKRTIQISRAANTYLVVPDGAPPVPALPPPSTAAPKPAGSVSVTTTVVDTGERKSAFGQQARHVKTVIEQQPMPGACDTTKQRVETDGWSIDMPKPLALRSNIGSEQAAGSISGCSDRIEASTKGDPNALGFPIAYTTTITGEDGKPVVATMELTHFELTTLDAALFEIPPGMNAANDVQGLSKALSDANEAKLAQVDAAPGPTPQPKAPGVIRIGVPELTNKTSQAVDTRALRQRLTTALGEVKLDAVPMAAAPAAELQKRAQELGYDYVLLAEVTELKASKPGKFGSLMSAASGVAGGKGGVAGAAAGAAGAGAGGTSQEKTESTLAVKLIQPDGKQRLATTSKGKDGSGFSLQTGLGLAKFAGSMYLTMLAGPQMAGHLSSFGAANLGGMGVLGNPMLHRMQVGGLGGLGRGAGIDQTAGAASYVMQQAMVMSDARGLVGVPGQGPSYDESLGEAVQNAAKAVQKALQKK